MPRVQWNFLFQIQEMRRSGLFDKDIIDIDVEKYYSELSHINSQTGRHHIFGTVTWRVSLTLIVMASQMKYVISKIIQKHKYSDYCFSVFVAVSAVCCLLANYRILPSWSART